MAELETKALYIIASLETNVFPAISKITLNRFGLQRTA